MRPVRPQCCKDENKDGYAKESVNLNNCAIALEVILYLFEASSEKILMNKLHS